jgi:serine/threonine protein kinase
VRREDIVNEARAVAKLCDGTSKFVVNVAQHGWLPHNTSYYYIDMEYCPETLESRVLQEQHHLIYFADGRIEVLLSQLKSIIEIAFDVGMGLAYIHTCGTVHRDLKPRNSRRQTKLNG